MCSWTKPQPRLTTNSFNDYFVDSFITPNPNLTFFFLVLFKTRRGLLLFQFERFHGKTNTQTHTFERDTVYPDFTLLASIFKHYYSQNCHWTSYDFMPHFHRKQKKTETILNKTCTVCDSMYK